jgi:leucine dehydrogenase
MHLVELLVKENAAVFVTDIAESKIAEMVRLHRVTGVAQDEIYDLDVDIYAPCALGATLNDDTISRLKCSIIAGAANNQLKDETKHGYQLLDRSITYAPDFLINAGGLMNVYYEYLGQYNRQRVMQHAEGIYSTCLSTLHFADQEKIAPQEAAIRLAEQRIEKIGKIRMLA